MNFHLMQENNGRIPAPACIERSVVLGYDRNDKTVEAFKENGFDIIHAQS